MLRVRWGIEPGGEQLCCYRFKSNASAAAIAQHVFVEGEHRASLHAGAGTRFKAGDHLRFDQGLILARHVVLSGG